MLQVESNFWCRSGASLVSGKLGLKLVLAVAFGSSVLTIFDAHDHGFDKIKKCLRLIYAVISKFHW
jgi:hypothetical protein